MNELAESVDDIVERAVQTKIVADTLKVAPHNWEWPEVSLDALAQQIADIGTGLFDLSGAGAVVAIAAGQWDAAIDGLPAKVNQTAVDGIAPDTSYGLRLARVQFKSQPAKLALFEGLRLNNTGRESRYRQALDFEASWRKADAAWVFKPGLTLGNFKTRREALRGLEEAHLAAVKDETYLRAQVRADARVLHQECVDWYEAATATFAENTAPGSLVRTIPTTYDPHRPPGPLVFRVHVSVEAGRVELRWRAPRAEDYVIEALAPGASEWVELLKDVKENSWKGEGLAGGFWKFRGRARNRHGTGAMSEPVEVAVAVPRAA